MKLNINPATLFTKNKGVRIGSTLFKAKCWVVPVKLAALLKKKFLYETFSGTFLRSHSFQDLWVASCERHYNKVTFQRLTKNVMSFAGANRIFALKKFRISPSQMFCKIVLLKSFKDLSVKHLCRSPFLMHLQF